MINNQITSVQAEVDKVDRKHVDAIRLEQADREQADTQLRQKLEGLGTGGFSISLMGAAWLVVGLVLSTASQELAVWFGS